MLNGKNIGTHPARVVHLKLQQDATGGHMLFVAASSGNKPPAIFQSLQNLPVVTIGDGDHFASQGGMIGLIMESNKVRFEISLDAAGRARLKFSSRLLTLAKTVITTGKAAGD